MAGGQGNFHVGTVSLMPADNMQGMRADVIRLLKELNATVYRWPGGSFVNGYNWRNAVGEWYKRPPRLNASYKEARIESNDFGPDGKRGYVKTIPISFVRNSNPMICPITVRSLHRCR